MGQESCGVTDTFLLARFSRTVCSNITNCCILHHTFLRLARGNDIFFFFRQIYIYIYLKRVDKHATRVPFLEPIRRESVHHCCDSIPTSSIARPFLHRPTGAPCFLTFFFPSVVSTVHILLSRRKSQFHENCLLFEKGKIKIFPNKYRLLCVCCV